MSESKIHAREAVGTVAGVLSILLAGKLFAGPGWGTVFGFVAFTSIGTALIRWGTVFESPEYTPTEEPTDG